MPVIVIVPPTCLRLEPRTHLASFSNLRSLRQSNAVNRCPRSERAEIVALSIYFAAAERGKPVTRGA